MISSDRERAAAAEATIDFLAALNAGAATLPPPPPGSVFLIRRADGGHLEAVLLDYRGVEVAEFAHGGTAEQFQELGRRLGFAPDRIRRSPR
jgi:hypothetical protein